MNQQSVITEIMSIIAPEGEDNSEIKRFHVALMMPEIIRQLVMTIAQGEMPQGMSLKNTGLSGNGLDINNIQQQLQKTFQIDISADGEADITVLLDDPEPILLIYPFKSVRHSSMKNTLSMYVPDLETIEGLEEYYGGEAIIYTIETTDGIPVPTEEPENPDEPPILTT